MGIAWKVYEIVWIFIILVIKKSVTLNEGQGQYDYRVVHSHVWGSHRARFDDDDSNSFAG